MIKVNPDRCVACEACIDSCPYGAIEMQGDKAVINELCMACRACISECPEGAIVEEGGSSEAAGGAVDHAQRFHGGL